MVIVGDRSTGVLVGAVILGLLFGPAAWAASQVQWQNWSEEAFAAAKSERRLVLVDLSAEWCAFCKKMDATTWQDPKVQAAIEQHYLPIKVVDENDSELARKYRDYGRPAVVIMDGDGREILRKRGYLKPQWMQWMLEAVVQEQGLSES